MSCIIIKGLNNDYEENVCNGKYYTERQKNSVGSALVFIYSDSLL